MSTNAVRTDTCIVETEPYYIPLSNEVELFTSAYENQIPVLLKGPTGCGKTRFVQYMAWKFQRPLITVSCHDDLTASDLVGRYLVRGGETEWVDGPLTQAVKAGGICYLDEIVEARKDTTVVIHPLADDRRILTIEKKAAVLKASPQFMLTISYNPGYQSVLKELKQSTRQRFLAIEFSYPRADIEKDIVSHESGVGEDSAEKLVSLGEKTRHLKDRGLAEGASTRLLIYAGKLITFGIEPRKACQVGVAEPLTDDREMLGALSEIISSLF